MRFNRRLYTMSQAARLVGMSRSTLATWAIGDKHPVKRGLASKREPVVTSLSRSEGDDRTIPFIGLVEATVVQAFRQTGLPMQRIRSALKILSEKDELGHALASKRLYSDGAQVLLDYAESEEDRQLRLLVVVVSGQRVFHEVIDEYLQRITFDESGGDWASELILPVTDRRLLRVIPGVASGDPLFVNGGAPLSAVRSRFMAGEPITSIERDYDTPSEDIEEAINAIWPQAQAA